MSAPTQTVSPISSSNSWLRMRIGGLPTPTIPRGGLRGFLRETGWDELHGKGSKGATLIRKTAPPLRGAVMFQLFTDQDFATWDFLVLNVLYDAPSPTNPADGINIYYPAFASVGFTKCVVKSYSPPDHMGRGLYHTIVELIEWQQPPPSSIVKAVQKAAGDLTGELGFVPGKAQRPAQAQLAALQAENRAKQAQLALAMNGGKP